MHFWITCPAPPDTESLNKFFNIIIIAFSPCLSLAVIKFSCQFMFLLMLAPPPVHRESLTKLLALLTST